MSSTVEDFHRRFEVQIADVVSVMGEERRGVWRFHLGFRKNDDARAAAERLSEDNRWVRVVDTQNEENN